LKTTATATKDRAVIFDYARLQPEMTTLAFLKLFNENWLLERS
jgi:hypothetical protein